ncbi:GDA1/CD39 nucleoside phosphatase family protein [Nitzschia inconspicua]|uniref:GDA1/CD39 nucleoside phosphatase family protein n=1 Tax=Nitzschia inconspicua TaxID=303405 RepID=A0A9K3LIQ8_9STRA|nr:GDA1/CD39 nucleoside phosphatase family protein [Nitzschia inconspicua]
MKLLSATFFFPCVCSSGFVDSSRRSKNLLSNVEVLVDSSNIEHQRHPLEDLKSWELFRQRSQQEKQEQLVRSIHDATHRHLASYVTVQEETEEGVSYTIQHKKIKRHIPYAGGDTTHGMMIDAGSQGTRLHIYEWDKRFLLDQEDLLQVTKGRKLSIPTSDSRWTDKYLPGLDVIAVHKKPEKLKQALSAYLGPLIDFAKQVLTEKQDQFHTYPIFLKATGGMRTLPQPDRVRLMNTIRELFHDHENFNPFAFEDEQARVISGEEEAIYGWVGVNFAKGTLIDDSVGNGVGKNPKLTYGMLEMGGASTQIAFFENNGDLMADLFKLQLGGSRHWNVYTHSYLYFGINGAWTRLNGQLYGAGKTENPCLPIGGNGKAMQFKSWATTDEDGNFLPRSDPRSVMYSVNMTNSAAEFDFDACSQNTHALLHEETNKEFCDFEMDGSCAFAGIYQPPLPQVNNDIDEFIATSNFVDVFNFLQLGERAAISEIVFAAKKVCSLSWTDLQEYNANLDNGGSVDDLHTLAQMCFRSIFVYQLLRNGWGFGDNYVMTVADVINGQKMGWALGCMLYEINTLPWEFHPEFLYKGRSWWQITLYIILGTLVGSATGFALAMRMSKKFNKAVRESVFFRNTGFAKNPLVRKSLALPPLDELSYLYDDDEKEEDESAALSNKPHARYS